MDQIKLMMYGKEHDVDYDKIIEIKNGQATTTTGRTYDIVCDCLSINDYETVPDSEAPGGNGYIVCEICHRIHYLKDLRDMQDCDD